MESKTCAEIDVEKCSQIAEGKTKQILEVPGTNLVVIRSKDQITAFNALRKHDLTGKAMLSNLTTCKVFQFLNSLGVRTHFVKQMSDKEFLAKRCVMIPLEWVARRVATGSFLKRNPSVKQGYRFNPPKIEIFYKDDEKGDPEWSKETLEESGLTASGIHIGKREIELMSHVTRTIFEVLETAWLAQGCSLIDMKVEFGVDPESGDIILADVIDNDSWRLWPGGDKRLQVDKQYYRDLPEVTPENLEQLKKNFSWVVEKLDKFVQAPCGRVVVVMGSASDYSFCKKIESHCKHYGIPCILRVSSAHKSTEETLKLISEYEGDHVSTVFIAVAGKSNGLGPVLAGNTCFPVINCPPKVEEVFSPNIWSSLSLPSGLGCCTVCSPEASVMCAASILALQDFTLKCRMKMKTLLNYISTMKQDKHLEEYGKV
ncbi:unnamed protein product [Soboliphyme baturini]|uniref:AIRC domain-containing protein n=1 Tax=Soboliphyme baturini TaxID=241478 RepID=A0A183IZH9_9BILA|nr:unnamed protein product [Soboliphyme baturini]